MTKVDIYINGVIWKPNWGDGTKRKYNYKGSFDVSQKFTFYRGEAKEIINSPLDSVFDVTIIRNDDIWFTGEFRKVDCKISEVRGQESIEVSFKKKDGYSIIQDFQNREFDIIQDTGVRESSIIYDVPAAVQLFIPGSDIVNTVVGERSYESDAGPFSQVTRDSGFERLARDVVYVVADHETDVTGRYETEGLLNQIGIKDDYVLVVDTAAKEMRIRRLNGTEVFYKGTYETNPYGNNLLEYQLIQGVYQGYNGPSAVLTNSIGQKVRVYSIDIWARILSNKSEINGVQGNLINNDTDFIGTSYSYWYNTGSLFGASVFPINISTESASSGQAEIFDGSILNPGSFFVKKGTPIFESKWYEFAIFYDGSLDLPVGGEEITLRHAYKLEDIINKWLEWRNSEVRTKLQTDLYITPSTNITAGKYSINAKKALTSLDRLFGITMHVLDKDFYVTQDNEMVFLDRSEFEDLDAFLDVTKLKEPRSGVSWDYNNKVYTYEISNVPERVEFKFPLRSSDVFNGLPIIHKSTLVKEELKNTVSVDFITDLQYVLINSAEVSRDAFVLLYAPNGRVAYETIEGIAVQNGYLSWTAIHDRYKLHATPVVEVNGVLKNAEAVKKYKKQIITLPNVKFVQLKGIITSLGKGKIDSIEEDLLSGQLTVTLLHND